MRYSDKLSADHCLQEAKEGKISLGGRELIVTVAVSRENAASLTENNKKEREKKDNRNLYLAREGCKFLNLCLLTFIFFNLFSSDLLCIKLYLIKNFQSRSQKV